RALYARVTDQIVFLSGVILPSIDFSLQIFVSDVMPLRADQRLDPPARDRISVERPGLALNLSQRRRPGVSGLRPAPWLPKLEQRGEGKYRLPAGADKLHHCRSRGGVGHRLSHAHARWRLFRVAEDQRHVNRFKIDRVGMERSEERRVGRERRGRVWT